VERPLEDVIGAAAVGRRDGTEPLELAIVERARVPTPAAKGDIVLEEVLRFRADRFLDCVGELDAPGQLRHREPEVATAAAEAVGSVGARRRQLNARNLVKAND